MERTAIIIIIYLLSLSVRVRVNVCVLARACARARVCLCVCACVRACVCVCNLFFRLWFCWFLTGGRGVSGGWGGGMNFASCYGILDFCLFIPLFFFFLFPLITYLGRKLVSISSRSCISYFNDIAQSSWKM